MKRLLIIICLLCAAFTVQSQTLRVVMDVWQPMAGPGLPNKGFSAHLTKKVFEELGYETSIDFLPWNRIQKTRGQGRYDIISALWFDKKRLDHMEYSEPYGMSSIVFISAKGSEFHYKGPESLKGKRVGLISSYAYPRSLMNLEGVEYHYVNSANQNMRKVVAGRIDLTLGDSVTLEFKARKFLGLEGKLYFDMDNPVANNPVYLAISKQVRNHRELLKGFNGIVKRYKKDGTFLKLLKEHGLK